MNRLMRLAIAAGLTVAGLPALAQVPPPPTVSLTVDQQELALIGKGLGTLPYADVAALMVKLQNQVIGQQKPAEPKTEKPKAP